MNINQINLNDFCQHEQLNLQLSPGVNLLLGPVGCGKSTVLRALEFGLTGSMPITRRLEENVRGLGDHKLADQAKVRLNFEAQSVPGFVERTIKADGGSRARFRHLNDEEVRSASRVNQAMQNLLGLDPKTAGQLMFVRQGELNTLLSARDAERKTLLQRLFGVSFLSGLSDKLYDERERYAKFQVPDETPEDIRGYIRASQQDLESAEKAAQAFRSASDPGILRDHRKALHDHSVGVQAAEEANRLWSRHAALQGQIKDALSEVRDAETSEHQAKVDRESAEADAQGAQSIVDQAQHIRRARQQYEQARQDVARRENEYQDHLESRPVEVEDPTPTIQSVEPDLQNSRNELQRCRDFLRAFGAQETHQCPTCGTRKVVDEEGQEIDMGRLIRETRDRAEELETEVRETSDLVTSLQDEWRDYQSRLQRFQQRLQVLGSQRDQARQVFESLGEPPEEVDESDAASKLELARQAKQSHDQAVHRLQSAQREYDRLQSLLVSSKCQIEDVEKRTALRLDDSRVDELKEEVDRMEQSDRQAAQKEGEAEQIRRQLELLNRRLSRSEQAMSRLEGQKQYLEVLDHARQLVHRDKLPTLLAQPFVDRLNRLWNETLSMLSMRFTAELVSAPGQDNDLSFSFSFPEGHAQSYQLSGGQRCAASLSLLISVNRLLSRSNLLVLDEPTYGFSRAELELLPEMIRQLQTYAVNSGLQVIMVTHEQSLFSDFDNVIHLE